MFGFHFAIYGEMLTYGFLKKKPSFVSPVNDKIGDAHLGVDFFCEKINSVRLPDAVRGRFLNLRFIFFNMFYV